MNEYSPIANKSSRIFFALDTLETIHYLYRYSLAFFMDVLSFIINSKELTNDPDKYIHCIWYCFNHKNFNLDEVKYINELKSTFEREKIPICFISTITIKYSGLNF